MVNAVKLTIGRTVWYRTASGKWLLARITAITSQTALKLAVPRHTSDPNYAVTPLTAPPGVAGQMTQLNSNLDINRCSVPPHASAQTNVWRPY